MNHTWDSTVLRSVPVAPRSLATNVARVLGQDSPAALDVVLLHVEALDAALSLGVPELLADQLRWQEVRLRAADLPFGPDDVAGAVHVVLAPLLDAAAQAQVEQVHGAAAALQANWALADDVVELPEGPARDYLFSALSGNRDAAIKVVREAMLADVEVVEIMMGILQPAQLELGRLWEAGLISVAHEHLTTSITQVALSLLYPRLQLNRTWSGYSVVASSVGSEAHEVGIRMISDLLEQAGWRTSYLGADVPHRDVVDRVAQHRANVLAVSATMAGHVPGVRQLVSMLREDPRTAAVKVLVGGRPFAINPGLAERLGADGWAPDARAALALCQAWAGTLVRAG